MPKILVTGTDGVTSEVIGEAGLSLMEVLRDAEYEEIQAMCGGSCSCATCHVHIKEDWQSGLPQIEEDEQLLLELADNYDPELSRLSCQIELSGDHDGLQVLIVESD
jgi:2Fe-2S ferredoxin